MLLRACVPNVARAEQLCCASGTTSTPRTPFLEILAKHRKHETAEYAAHLLLDTYNRLAKYDELVALAERLRADTQFLADKPDLAELVKRIREQSLRKAKSAPPPSAPAP